jgi:HEAT repeat protein
LDARALPTTVSLLETVENRKARKALCDIIMMQSGGRGKLLVPFLSHKMWFVARNIVMIMGKLADQDTILALGQAMRNPDPRVRREVVSALYTLKGKRVEEFLSDAVSDEDRQVRVLAGRLLGELAPDKAFERLIRVFIGPNFGELELEEMRDVSEQLGKAGGEKAIPSLAAVFRKKGLFASGKREKMRIAAAYGLAAAGGEQAREMLESETGSKNDLLRRACVEGLRTIKLRGGR